ncbi:MAG: hypothetical protein P8M26_05670 [Gammaproteobacteria bacterium]|nr:hypothetical protein [Gammaproteobacteria bacterium]
MRNLILFLFMCVTSLVVAELALRVALPQPGFSAFPKSMPADLLQVHPGRSYSYRPGFSADIEERFGTVNVSINSLGMRDAEVSAGESIDVLAIGDSFTAGAMVEQQEAWPAQLEQQLNAGGRDLRVLNAGVSGYNIEQIRIAGEELVALNPGAIIVGAYPVASSRLSDPFVWFNGYSVRQSKVKRLRLTDSGFLLATNNRWLSNKSQFWLFENTRFGGWLWSLIAPYVETRELSRPSPEELSARFLDQLSKLYAATSAADIPLIVFVVAHQHQDGTFLETLAVYNRLVVDYCVANGIPVFDSLGVLAAYPVEGVEFRAAGGSDFHWSPLAHAVSAKGLAGYIVEQGLIPDASELDPQ